MSAKLEAKSLGPGEEEVVLHAPEATAACGDAGKRSLAMAMAEAATLHLPAVSLPLLSSRAAPLHLRATHCLPLAPLVASSDAVEAGVEWTESGDEAEAGDAFEEVREEEGELVASGEEDGDLETDYPTAVEPPEEAKVYVGNLPYNVDSEGLAQLFEPASVVEIAEEMLGLCIHQTTAATTAT